MPSKKMLIAGVLENLSKKNFEKFGMALVARGGDRKVAFSRVEDKNFIEVARVLVSTFTEDDAPAVTSELLKSINCFDEAKKLDEQMAEQFPKSSRIRINSSHLGSFHEFRWMTYYENLTWVRWTGKSLPEGAVSRGKVAVLFNPIGDSGYYSGELYFSWWPSEPQADGLMVEQPQAGGYQEPLIPPWEVGGYQEPGTNQSYESLLPGREPFTPAAEGSHSPFPSVKSDADLGYSRYSADLYPDSDSQRRAFWSEYSPFGFGNPLPHPPTSSICPDPTNASPQPSDNYYPRAPERDSHTAMPSKKMLIADVLENLSKKNFEKFGMALVARGGDRKVAFSRVEDKNFIEVAHVLVSTFTEDDAPAVTSELLKSINCFDEAKKLDEQMAELFPKSSRSRTPAGTNAEKAGCSGDTTCSSEVHFVDKHKLPLIERVCNIDSILDFLLKKNVIQDEIYEKISGTPGNQGKTRNIYNLALKSGIDAKNIFLESLKKYEPLLVADLERGG
ncbi:apoptosis-associated speck-like protein containing a CARD [Hippocampus zosterae]|uniref:apoptosis-associated speck-like protein containing a CARD n=1 Tax=Hippocampus zosterae TaxID=109293 RepID=UPI00223CF795|nr:apoptosis-associated speck-like protein containing a CARD [Hippocampus zosterae]